MQTAPDRGRSRQDGASRSGSSHVGPGRAGAGRRRGPRIGLRGKLLFAASILLIIPLLGFRYVRELEELLLNVQEQGLASTARAIATALNDRPSVFLSGEVYPFALALDRDLKIENLSVPMRIDGLADDWTGQPVTERPVGSALGNPQSRNFSARFRIGRHGNYVYALFQVVDPAVILRDPDRDPIFAADHIEVAVVTPDDEFLRFLLSGGGSGPLTSFLTTVDDEPIIDTRIRAALRLVPEGYVVELRMPRSLIGPRLGFTVVNIDDAESRAVSVTASTSDTQTAEGLGAVLIPSPEVAEIVRSLGRAQSRIWVVDTNRRVIAQAGTLEPARKQLETDTSRLGQAWDFIAGVLIRPVLRLVIEGPHMNFRDLPSGTYRLDNAEISDALAGLPGTSSRLTKDTRAVVMSAAHPVWSEDEVVGAVLVEETTNDVLAIRNRVFEKLFTGLLAVYVFGAAALLIFATRLSLRVRRLRDETERAIDDQGRVIGMDESSTANDELGDLSRSFADVLRRLKNYTGYLENLASRLSHEMRTPVAIVRSSLDNLSLTPLPHEARVYMQRAEEGLGRLARIFSRMSEATRLEQTLSSVERESFDLRTVTRGCVDGYRTANPGKTIELEAPDTPMMLFGAPDLIAQMLDKLVANALEFSTPDAPIVIRLAREPEALILTVSNEGPLLPAEMQEQLFDSMVSVRPNKSGDEAHLGLGLYIVRLIADFHSARASAGNRDDGRGVIITVRFRLPHAAA